VNATTDARGNTTSYEYDANCGCSGRRSKITDALNHETHFSYDDNGNQSSMLDANGHAMTYQYDALNRRTKVIYADSTFDQTGYDAVGRVVSKTDQAGKLTQYGYDALGRLIRVTDALNQITQYGYDELGNQTSQTDALGRITKLEYDKLGRRTKRTLPLNQVETYTYNSAGNLLTRRDFNAKTTTYAYDAMNRLLSKTPDVSFAAPAVTFTYSFSGRRLTMNDAHGVTSYGYDSRDRLLSKATPEGTLSYTYDAASNALTLRSSNSNGVSVDYGYDLLNRLSTVIGNGSGARAATGTTTYSYDAVGNLSGYAYPNAVETSYQYNTLNRLTSMTISKTATNLASFTYVLGAAGNRTSVTELSGRTADYTYDELYRLKSETITGDPVTANNGAINYTFDAVGNRLNRTSTVVPIPTTASSFDGNDRLGGDTYDANGSTTASAGKTYVYDFENRIKSVNSGQLVFVYDGDGNRVAKTVAGVTTKFLVDTNSPTSYAQVVEEIVGSNVQRVYEHGHSLLSQTQLIGTNWVTSFYGFDGHGSVRFLTDSTGAVTDTYTYDAFGNLIASTGTTPNNYLYAGEQFDTSLGFCYLRARYLNPSSGRFWTMDSFEGIASDLSSVHKYLYADADPINRLDRSGNFSVVEAGASLSIRAVLANVLVIGVGANIAIRLKVELPSSEPDNEPETSPDLNIDFSTPPQTTTQEDDDNDRSETFYRAMGPREYANLYYAGRLSLKSNATELFVTQSLEYVASMSYRKRDLFPIIVRFNVTQGTRDTLTSRGAINNSTYANAPALRYLPEVGSGNPNQVFIKYENGALTYGLRRNTISIFNDRIKSFRRVGYEGALF
jgi:RHS repeat-associated protein